MAGRGRARVLDLSDRQPPLLGREPMPPPRSGLMDDSLMLPLHRLPGHHPSFLLEERLAAQHREIHELLHDNQRLAAVHVALKQEVDLAQHQVQFTAASATQANAEKDAQAKAVYEKALALEAQARMVEREREELAAVRSDIKELQAGKADLVERLQGIRNELSRAREKVQQVPAIMAEIDTMQLELQRGRVAIDYEKKARAGNMEQSREMEKNMMSMANELERLRAELADAEKRARAAAAAAAVSKPGIASPIAAGYAGYGNPELAVQTGGASYANAYGMHQAQSGAASGGQYQGQGGGTGGGAAGMGSYSQYWSGNAAANSQYGGPRNDS